MDSDPDAAQDEAFPPLPPPRSPGRGGHDEGDPFANGEEDGEVSNLADVPAAKRKGVRRPQPKLDSQRLISDRGLPALRTLFETVHFRGKGHEADDLRRLMQRMENWAHRLYPKLQFDDFIERVEKLGNKKEVQTCLKRIRLDMPLTHEDYAGDEEAAPEPHASEDPDPFGDASFPGGLWAAAHSTPAPTTAALSPPAPSLTEEQRQRMELNRRRALERKLARRQQQPTEDPADSQTADSPTPASSSADVLRNPEDQGQDQNQDQGKGEGEGEGAEDFDPEPASSSDPHAGSPPRRDKGEEAGEEDGDRVPNKSSCL